jgi:pyruvate,water dikinase
MVLEVMAEHGLRRRERGVEVYVMCEIPSNVLLAREFARLPLERGAGAG